MIQAAGFATVAISYLVVAAILLVLGRGRALALAAALGCHGLWGISPFIAHHAAFVVADFAHLVGWAVFFAALGRRAHSVLTLVALASVAVFGFFVWSSLAAGWPGPVWLIVLRAAAAVGALVAVGSAYRSATEEVRWHIRLLALPLAAVFAFDLFAYASELAGVEAGAALAASRGLINAAAFPFVCVGAFRSRVWRTAIEISHQAAVYSTALIISGVYFTVVAVLTWLLPELVGRVGPELQVTFLFATTVLLMAVLSAGSTRARLRYFVARHLLKRKYDYRQEWRAFMDTMASQHRDTPIEQRIIMACANILESPGGALWHFEGERPRLRGTWNFRARYVDAERIERALFLTSDGTPVPVTAEDVSDQVVDTKAVWLLVPLVHNQRVVGFLSLLPPRAQHTITWEDRELLDLVSRQCGHYLVEQDALRELEEARQFDRFNRQYAFVVHDIKNLVSHLATMMHNAERHWDNPEFQRDFRDSVRSTVSRMNGLLDRVAAMRSGESDRGPGGEVADVLTCVNAAVESQNGGDGPCLRTRKPDGQEPASVRMSHERLQSILDHLISNAVEAAGRSGTVDVAVDRAGAWVIVDVTDDGPGMSAEYVETRLFRPFRTSKRSGMGLGTYQIRETAREHGGDVEVITSEGSGTTMRLRLPRATDWPAPAYGTPTEAA
jgi:putative PEP-CTERM system histidine kinase